MENQDRIFDQFKEISREAESNEFPAMEKVWSRVEDKLDYKAATKSAGIWKMVAIAASVLLIVTVGYQVFESKNLTPSGKIENQIVESPNPPQPTEKANVIREEEKAKASEPYSVQVSESESGVFDTQKSTANAVAIAEEDNIVDPLALPAEPASRNDDESTSFKAHPNVHTITGIVSDQAGLLPGANVVVMGTTRGTQTDIDGKYRIEAKEGDQLVFSFVGMKDFVATVGNQSQINAKLPDSGALLESVVADGYNSNHQYKTQSDKDGKRNANKVIAPKTPEFRSRIVNEQDNDENAISTNIEFVSNGPTLYIIDGVAASEAQFKQLKTEEIATMKLLSQSEATSMYGNKAVNGAMIVSKKDAKKAAPANPYDEESLENAFESPVVAPLSTFKLSVETSSYAEVRNFINKGQKVPASVVRIEEMINYFEYRYPQPEAQYPVSINSEYSSCPWNSKHKLLKVGIQGKNVATMIVKDAKIQVEFNPSIVKGYRLIGYEKRSLRPDDFKNTNRDAGLSGGHTVTALYEIIPNGVDSQYFEQRDDITYTKVNTGTTFGGELATIKFRYQKPDNGKSAEMVKSIANKPELLQNSSNDFRFCASVAWFGLKLRQSELIGNRSYAELLKLAKGSISADSEGSKMEFIRLVEAVK